MLRKRVAAIIAVLTLTGSMTACGDDASAPTPDAGFTGRGPITLASGKDTTGTLKQQLDGWNAEHPDEKVTLVELPESADQQRQQFIQNAQTKSDAYTVLNMDVVWTAEFAANQWIDALPADQLPLDQMIPAVVESGRYFDRLYAVPYNTNAGLLFYRKDLLDKVSASPPRTWADLKSVCERVKALPEAADVGCYAGQFDKYEGLTVNFSEAVHSAGGTVVGADGKPSVATPEAQQGLRFLVNGFTNGEIPKEAITYKEEEGRRAFQDGKLIFHRQWPYQWTLANKTDGSSKIAGRFAVAVLPGATGPGRSSLGGANLAISRYGRNKATALDFVKWLSGPENARQNLEVASAAPVYGALYADPDLRRKFPYLAVLQESLNTAVPRPRVVAYGDATAAIQENAYAALTGAKPVEQALFDMQKKLEEVTAGR